MIDFMGYDAGFKITGGKEDLGFVWAQGPDADISGAAHIGCQVRQTQASFAGYVFAVLPFDHRIDQHQSAVIGDWLSVPRGIDDNYALEKASLRRGNTHTAWLRVHRVD